MRQRDDLPNPYASTLPPDEAEERSIAFQYLLASAVTAGVVVGGALATGGVASAGTAGTSTAQEDTGGQERFGPLMRLVDDTGRSAGSPTDPVGAADAAEFLRGVTAALALDRAGLEQRIAVIRAAGEQRGIWTRKQIARAEQALDGLWRPASEGIVDFAGSIAATAAQLDVPSPPATVSDLVASPALVRSDGGRVSKGRELLEWGSDWVDRMAEDLVDTIDAMLDRIELRIAGRSSPGHTPAVDGRSPVLSVVASEPRSGSA